jgi:uncharacterized membrane protein
MSSSNTLNIGFERAASFAAGCVLVGVGLRKRSWSGSGITLLGAGLIRKSFASDAGVTDHRSDETSEAVIVNLPRPTVYRFWKEIDNLAEFLARRSADIEIINEIDNKVLGWRALSGTGTRDMGTITFNDAPAGRGTEVRVTWRYSRPGSRIAAAAMKLVGIRQCTHVTGDLKRFKTRLETGELPTVQGQPVGAENDENSREQKRNTEKIGLASEDSFPASDAPAYTH